MLSPENLHALRQILVQSGTNISLKSSKIFHSSRVNSKQNLWQNKLDLKGLTYALTTN